MPDNTEFPKWVIGTLAAAVIATAICTATIVGWLTRYEVRAVWHELQSHEGRVNDLNNAVLIDLQGRLDAVRNEQRDFVNDVKTELRDVEQGLDDLKDSLGRPDPSQTEPSSPRTPVSQDAAVEIPGVAECLAAIHRELMALRQRATREQGGDGQADTPPAAPSQTDEACRFGQDG